MIAMAQQQEHNKFNNNRENSKGWFRKLSKKHSKYKIWEKS